MLADLVHWMIVPSEQTSMLRKRMQRSGTWADFVADLGPHVAGNKMGRAVVPYMAVWADDTQPRSGAHKVEGARWDIVSLDLDECTEDQFNDALEKLDNAKVSYLAHSTYSYDPNGVSKARIHIPLGVQLTVDEIPDVKFRLAQWLELDVDKATKGGYTLYFTPRCAVENLEHAFIVSRNLGPLYPDSMLPELAPRAAGLQKPNRVRPTAEPRTLESWPDLVKSAAQAQLDQLVRMLENNKTQSVRERLKGGVSLLAGYSAAGLISTEVVYERLVQAVKTRHANGRDDHSLDYRLKQLDEFMDWGEARPILPEGFDSDGELEELEVAAKSNSGEVRLTAQLAKQTPEHLYTVPEAGKALYDFLRQPRGLHKWLGLVEVSVGVGKTYALRKLAEERAERGEYTVILSLDHGLLGQIRRDLEREGVRVRHMHSLQQATVKTGGPQCAIANRPDVLAMTQNGMSLAGSVCPNCRIRPTCPAIKHKQRSLQEYVILAPYPMAARALALIDEANDSPGAPLVVCDEEPPEPEQVKCSASALDELAENQYVWDLLRSDQARAAQSFMEFVVTDTMDICPREVIDEVASYHGQLHAPKMSLWDLEHHEGAIEALKDLLRMANGHATLRKVKVAGEDEYEYQCEVVNGAWQALADEGGFVLTATPDYAVYEAFPLEVKHLTLRVKDSTPAPRAVLFTDWASRRKIMEDGNIDWVTVGSDLMQVFRHEPADRKILIGTYKAISDALKTTHKHILQGRDVEVTHYEVVRGRDDWRERDVFISLYDPRPGGNRGFNESTDAAARALEQFHGRSRDPQPRKTGANHYHIGTVAPRTWWLDDGQGVGDGRTRLQLRPKGKPPNPFLPEAVVMLRAYMEHVGGRLQALAGLEVAQSTWYRWLSGKISPPPSVVKKITEALDAALASA
jgi:hypothetical protein